MDRVVKNQNANETDIDKQFKDDLERATALSLETLALEEFRRNRSLHSVGGAAAAVATTSELSSVISASSMKFSSSQNNLSSNSIKSTQPFQRPRPGSFGNSSSTGSSFGAGSSSGGGSGSSSNNIGKSTFPTSSSSGSLAPPPSNTPRNTNRTKTNDADLISFAHPTIDNDLSNDSLLLGNDSDIATATAAAAAISITSPNTVNDSHSNFKQMVDEIHRRNAQYNVTAGIHNYQHQVAVATANANAAAAVSNMQLMPYTAQTKTLNPDELSKLYSMNQYARPMLPSSNMLNFPTQIHTGVGVGIGMGSTQQQIPTSNIANQMSLAQANSNSAQFLTTSPYLQQQQTQQHQQARSPVYPYPYHPTTGISSIERPLISASNLSYAQQPQPNVMINSMAMQHHQQQQQQQQPKQHQQSHSPAFPTTTNLSTNPDTTLAHLGHNKASISIDTKNIPLSPDTNPAPKSTNKLCDNSNSNSNSNNSNVIMRRTSNAVKPKGDDLIDLENGIEDSLRVSVLEAFDPLLLNDSSETTDQGDAASECGTSYYSEYDPFDYLYSSGTQYSDPVYEAVIKIDRTPISTNANQKGRGYGTSGGSSSSGPNQTFDFKNYDDGSSDRRLDSPFATTPDWDEELADFTMISPVTATETTTTAPPLPPRNYNRQSLTSVASELSSANQRPNIDRTNKSTVDRLKVATKLYENVIENRTYDAELVAFYNMVKRVRSKFRYNDELTNVGHIVAAEYNNHYPDGTEIKLLVHPLVKGSSVNQTNNNRNSAGDSGIEMSMADASAADFNGINNQKGQIEGYGPPVVFTCDIYTTVEHVIMHVFCELEGQQCSGLADDYILKPIGVNEWLRPTSKLSQLDCVHQSIKLEQDVQFGLWPKTYANLNGLARTQQDDYRDADLKPEDILAHEPVETINYDSLMILLETLEDEIAKIESTATDTRPHIAISQSGVVQAVKMICALFGSIDTLSIAAAIDALNRLISSNSQSYGSMLEVDTEIGDYAKVNIRPKTFPEQVKYCCNRIREAVQTLIDTFAHAFRVDFCVNTTVYRSNPIPITQISQTVMVHLMCLHRLPPQWKHDYYVLGAMIYHGTRYIGDAVVTQCSNDRSGLFARNLKFDSWLRFDSIPICTLPRESRLIFVLYGCTTEPAEGQTAAAAATAANANEKQQTDNSGQDKKVTKVELGWSSIQFFNFEREMIEGAYLLPQWPPTTDKFLGPAPSKGTHMHGDHCPTLSIHIPSYGGRVVFPEESQNTIATCLDFNSLDRNLQQELIDTAELGYPSALDKREVLWEKRYYLHKFPHALPKILHAAHSWDYDSAIDLHALIRAWESLSPLQVLELFLPRYPDMVVRAQAVQWISAMSNDQLIVYLPQLLQALKHDTYEGSALAEFLITRALESPRIAHHMYWLLVHSLPGDSPQNTIDQAQSDFEEAITTMARYNRRNQMMLRALLAICGERLSGKLLAQTMMCKSLADVAASVKQAKESARQKILVHGMENVNQILLEQPTALPLSPSFEVTAVNSRSCGYFNSNTLPLRVSYIGPDRMILPAIFKAGDDLQQDMLTIQLVRVMDRLWLEEGLDLKMVTFECVPTGHKRGMIEMVTDAETLRKIQVEWGLTGSFKDKPIAEWLERQNPSALEYQRAVDNFTVSCAGYSVVTYILGICDRHNDNIMLKTSGHLFHIDFGKFLGDAQMFGNFKRDRTPFVLTSDMAYVINMGDKPSIKFQHFVDLCCKAFNIVRKHGDLLLHMLALMATSGIPGVTADAVTYVRNALLPGQSNPEAAASFAKLIHISLKSWFTQFNFFLHNLAQMRFTGDECNGELLSFVPRTYTMAQDGRLKSVTVHGYQKRYDLEKYYTYILKVTRQNQPDPAFLFRSYKEFLEFHQKLCLHFPLAKLHSLSSGIHVGRSNVQTVAERRLPEIRLFLVSLFDSADEIAHSDLVYTFFHPILRDQQEQDINVAKVKDTRQITSPNDNVRGEIKLSVQYHRGALTVMIYHARSLPPTTSGQEPNTYVKAYLKPDPTKSTKRKTKVIRKNCFPSFMETLEYRMPLEVIQHRRLQVTVWSHDSLQENEFLGGVELNLSDLDLREEYIQWCPLGYVTRN